MEAEDPANFKFTFLLPSEENDAYICAVHTWDRTTTPEACPSIIMSDVTFGILAKHFSNQSTWLGVMYDREIRIMLQSSILHQNAYTFGSEAEMLISRYPESKTKTIVFFLDADPAKYSVVRKFLERAIIMLDVRHMRENFRKQLGWVSKAAKSSASSSVSPSVSSLPEPSAVEHPRFRRCTKCSHIRAWPATGGDGGVLGNVEEDKYICGRCDDRDDDMIEEGEEGDCMVRYSGICHFCLMCSAVLSFAILSCTTLC